MILRSLKLKNVKCFEDSEVEFGPGKNVIIGRNGSGKSTILQSILYSLYGHYPLGKNEELVRIGENSAAFELVFEHAGQPYIIERKIPLSGSVEAYLYHDRDSEPIAEKQTVVTDEITERLGIRSEIFSDVVLVRQGEIAKVIEMRGGERKELFDKLLGLHDYEIAYKRCNKVKSLLEQEIATSAKVIEAYRLAASKLDKRQKDLKKKRTELKQKSRELGRLNKDLTKAEAILSDFDKLEDGISHLETKMAQRQEAINDNETKASGYSKEIRIASDDIDLLIPETLDKRAVEGLSERAEEKQKLLKDELASVREDFEENSRKAERLETLRRTMSEQEADLRKQEESAKSKREAILSVLPALKKRATSKWAAGLIDQRSSLHAQKDAVENELEYVSKLESELTSQKREGEAIQSSIEQLKKDLNNNAGKATAGIGSDWRNLAEIDLRGISAKLRGLESRQENREFEIDSLKEKRSKKENLIDRYEDDIDDLSSLTGKKCPKCKQIVDESHAKELRNEIEEKLQGVKEELKKLIAEIRDTKSDLNRIIDEKEQLDSQKKRIEQSRIYLGFEQEVQERLKKEEARLKQIEKQKGRIEDELSSYETDVLKEKLTDLNEKISALDKVESAARELPSLESDIADKREAYEALAEEIGRLERESPQDEVDGLREIIGALEDKEGEASNLCTSFSNLGNALDRLSELVSEHSQDLEEVSSLKEEYDAARHDELKGRVKQLVTGSAKLTQRIDSLRNEFIPEAEELYNESREAAESIEQVSQKEARATESLKVLSKVREFFREVQIPLRKRDTRRASKHATEIFKTLIGSNEYDRIHIGENHDLMISRFGLLEPMSTLSGGEQVLAGLAVRLGFARALATSDLLLLDEPTAYLDDRRRVELVETLHRTTPANQMIIVTHDDEFQNIAERVIHVEKDQSTLTSSIG